jgi:multidrug resistance efflux pump/transcriptional regulator with GAF, ATPase, and Fis domain
MMAPLNDGAEVGALLLAAADAASRAGIVASLIVEQVPDSACAIHRFVTLDGTGDGDDEARWTVIGVGGDLSVEQTSLQESPLIGPLLADPPEVVLYTGADLRREDYSHLHVTRSIVSLAYLPLWHDERLIGAVEVVNFSAALDDEQLEEIAPLVRIASPAILAAEAVEQNRDDLLDSVHRMSQLYDLEKSLNATLEMDTVVAMIPKKAAAMLACQAVHLWLFEGDVLRLVSSHGEDGTVEVGRTQAAGQGYVADMAEEGEPLLIDDPADEKLLLRNAVCDDENGIAPITDALVVPLLQDEAEIGVLEAVNREGRPFDEDDQFFLSSMAETVSSALKNASLMLAERKLEILEALVRVSSEITSTLRLDRLLQLIVNSPQGVLPFEMCAIALDNRGRLQLKAISGMSSLPMGDAQVERIQDLLRWLALQPDLLHLKQHGEAGEQGNSDLPAPVLHHFTETGYRALYSLPLSDDQGRVGLLLYESSDAEFLDLPHTEMIKILAGQATVAIRNALLYREVPLISLLEPLIQKRAALLRTSGGRRLTVASVVAVVVLFLVFCPLPMRVTGDAVVAAQHMVTVAAPVDGNVEAVYVHEGQRVGVGDVLGSLNDWQWRTELATSEAKYQQAVLVMQDDLSHNAAESGADRAQAEYLRSEVERARTRHDSAELRSPIAGIVVTPNMQNIAGQHLDAGAAFAQVLDLNSANIQIQIPERDAALLAPGQLAAIKLDSYPQRTWRDRVFVVGPEALAGDGDRTFAAEVPVQNSDAMLRAGMTGKAKIFIGWRPAGYVLLRGPGLWIWQTMWNWIGW